ncbi:hypothetical protein BIY24_03800 [Halobacteriovorax marinus]|uniref:hypothetical protein n=1 Tax=Halobacteriovorax marinus TaxID=97084 RepID=UPI000BC2E278|nr:hypothetical protein [Halobacteriovorax marinus]ATH07090.1 hypothetical protein BIY24_03800 [Halobacteriovorax marinus]
MEIKSSNRLIYSEEEKKITFIGTYFDIELVSKDHNFTLSDFVTLFLYCKTDYYSEGALYRKAALSLAEGIGLNFKLLDEIIQKSDDKFQLFNLKIEAVEKTNSTSIFNNLIRVRQNYINALGSEPLELVEGQVWKLRCYAQDPKEYFEAEEHPFNRDEVLKIRSIFDLESERIASTIKVFDKSLLRLFGQRNSRESIKLSDLVSDFDFPLDELKNNFAYLC